MITYHEKDLEPILRNGDFEIFAHGCNCQRCMGAGIARLVKEIWPEAWQADMATKKGSEKLGTCGYVWTSGRWIVNAYTQDKFGGGKVRADYQAIESCFKDIAAFMREKGLKKLTIPKIGAGLAGGDWNVIGPIIERAMADFDVDIYYLPMRQKPAAGMRA